MVNQPQLKTNPLISEFGKLAYWHVARLPRQHPTFPGPFLPLSYGNLNHLELLLKSMGGDWMLRDISHWTIYDWAKWLCQMDDDYVPRKASMEQYIILK